MNNWTIAGRVGKDGTLRHTANGDPVLGFSVAVDQRKGGEKSTMWVDVSLWGKRAEALEQYVTKGSTVSVSGECGHREHDGKVYMTLRANEVTLLGGGQREEGQSRSGGTPARQTGRQTPRNAPARGSDATPGDDFDSDSIPFIHNRGIL